MKNLIHIIILLVLPLGIAFGQSQVKSNAIQSGNDSIESDVPAVYNMKTGGSTTTINENNTPASAGIGNSVQPGTATFQYVGNRININNRDSVQPGKSPGNVVPANNTNTNSDVQPANQYAKPIHEGSIRDSVGSKLPR
jgi:hypothetical protein